MAINKKINSIFKLMKIFLKQKEISAYDREILDEFKCSTKTLERYLKEIEELYSHIITIKRGHKRVWRLVKVSDIFEEFINNSTDLVNLFDLAKNFDPEIFKELEKSTLSKIAKRDESLFLFKNSIMEELKDEKTKGIFKNLKVAVKNREYRDITYTYNKTEVLKNLICLKLLFINNNWYLVVIDEKKDTLEFKRLSFIDKIEYSKNKTVYKKDISRYLEFLKDGVQNAMSLYGVEPKIATLKAKPNIAKYFKKGMKKLLPSQKFIKEQQDGSVIFTLEYTQELEILPSIQKWLPDLIIIDPLELKEAYIKKLQECIKNHSL